MPRGRHRNEVCTINSQIVCVRVEGGGGQWGSHGVNGGGGEGIVTPLHLNQNQPALG